MRTMVEDQDAAQVPELCKMRLLNYADTFYELSRDFEQGSRESQTGEDRLMNFCRQNAWDNSLLIRDHLCEMARIMTGMACELFSYRPLEERRRKKAVHALREAGIRLHNAWYIPSEDREEKLLVTISKDKGAPVDADMVADLLSVALNRRMQLSASSPLIIDETRRSIKLEREAGYMMLTGYARAVKENESISGDNYSVVSTENSRMTVMLSDGTGSGSQAGCDSSHLLDMMERLIAAGYCAEEAIRIANAAVYSSGDDGNHPTIDICEVDLQQGQLSVYKAGAAVTFLKYAHSVELIQGNSLPLGVFQQQQIIHSTKAIEDDCYIIMVSDGMVDAFRNQDYENTLTEIIRSVTQVNPTEIARTLLTSALAAGKGRIYDDMTIVVAGIWESTGT